MEIPEVNVRGVNINDINIPTNLINEIPDMPEWLTSSPPQAIPVYPPVTTQVGVPVVDMPGCVEAHEADDGRNDQLKSDDPKGVKTYCDAGVPSFGAMDYNKDDLTLTGPPVVAPKLNPEQPELEPPGPVEVPKGTTPPVTAVTEKEEQCEWYKELLASDPRCIQPTIAEKYLPPLEMVTTTATIAVVATSTAIFAKPVADLLLKAIKPTVKKVIKKIKEKLGKKVKVESVYERRKWQRSLKKK
tara:strand:+ start:121 stop:852 length:732 start_codon:yes stop_codon:yes gene_type:complete